MATAVHSETNSANPFGRTGPQLGAPLFAADGLSRLEASRAKMSNLRMALIALGCGAVFGAPAGAYFGFTTAPLGAVSDQAIAALASSLTKSVRAGEAPILALTIRPSSAR